MKKDIRFLLTNMCNYNCYFCHSEGVGVAFRKHELSVDNYVTLFKMYSDIEKWNGVTLSGGEPFIFRGVDKLMEKLYEEGAKITVVTNGSLLHLHLPILKYIERINVSIHTMNQEMYGEIIGREAEKLCVVKNNLQTVRALYPNLAIRLNVTPCKQNNWSIEELKDLIAYAKTINASIKCTELFPNNQEDCVTIETLREQLADLGYIYIPTQDRTECYEKEEHQVLLTQCTCSKAILSDSPIGYCRENHDLYVNHDATFPLCRLSQDYIDFWEEIQENNLDVLKLKMKLAQRKVSSELCNKHLRCIYF